MAGNSIGEFGTMDDGLGEEKMAKFFGFLL